MDQTCQKLLETLQLAFQFDLLETDVSEDAVSTRDDAPASSSWDEVPLRRITVDQHSSRESGKTGSATSFLSQAMVLKQMGSIQVQKLNFYGQKYMSLQNHKKQGKYERN